jgi:hypothetical protein
MPKNPPLSFAQVDELVAYDRDTGELTWKVHISRTHKAGEKAGSAKTLRLNRHGTPYNYSYITIRGFQTPSARVAWLLGHGEWPNGNVLFADGDATNLRLANLRLRDESLYAEPLPPLAEERAYSGKLSKSAQRKYGLVRYYGKDAPEIVDRLFIEQKGLCALCGVPGGHPAGSDPKTVLHTDHDHVTEKIRSLLCFNCNAMLGSSRDDPGLLRAAADYLQSWRDRHFFGGPEQIDKKVCARCGSTERLTIILDEHGAGVGLLCEDCKSPHIVDLGKRAV